MWMAQNLTNETSPLVQVMDWCRQATQTHVTQQGHGELTAVYEGYVIFKY